MIHLMHGAGLVLEVGLALFCFADVLLADEAAVRVLPRWGWVISILVFPLLGAGSYLVAGRTWRGEQRRLAAASRAAGAPHDGPAAGPDAGSQPSRDVPGTDAVPAPDAALLEALRQVAEEHEAMLRRWEDDLRAREARLRAPDGLAGPGDRRIGGPAAA